MKWIIPFMFPLLCSAQCDLEILDVDLNYGYITVAFNNTENCGGEASPDGISEMQFGFQALDESCNAINEAWDFPSGFSLSPEANHPGWVYSATSTELITNWTNLYDESIDPPYYTGDTVVFPIYNQYQSDCIDGPYANQLYCNLEGCIQHWLSLGLSIQSVIWQISYGPTMYAEDGGWAEVGANGDGSSWGSGVYDDENFLDNWVVVGPCGDPIPEVIIDTVYVELPPDTIVIVEVDTVVINDTIPIPINWYFYDTTYVYINDTIYVTEYDTVYQQLPPEIIEYYFTDTLYVTDYVYDTTEVYITDTVQEYIVQELWLDCDTGLPCDEQPGFDECEEMIVFVPNVFTPNNDGINDAFYAEQDDPTCWKRWEMSIYNRWGDVIFHSDDPEEVWDGGYGSYYAPDGVYAWNIKAKTYGGRNLSIQGSVQIFR